MRVFEISFPGTWVKWPDDDVGSKIRSLINVMVDRLDEAVIMLDHFQRLDLSASAFRADLEVEARRSDSVRREVEVMESETGESDTHLNEKEWLARRAEQQQAADRRALEADIASKRGAWETIEPIGYKHARSSAYARSFVFALHIARQALRALERLPNSPSGICSARESFEKNLLDLAEVRNSAYHIESRVSPEDKHHRPVLSRLVYLGGLGRRSDSDPWTFESLMRNGSVGRVELSERTLAVLQRTIQGVVNSFEWEHWPHHHPR